MDYITSFKISTQLIMFCNCVMFLHDQSSRLEAVLLTSHIDWQSGWLLYATKTLIVIRIVIFGKQIFLPCLLKSLNPYYSKFIFAILATAAASAFLFVSDNKNWEIFFISSNVFIFLYTMYKTNLSSKIILQITIFTKMYLKVL